MLFITALIVTVLAIPFAQMQFSRSHGDEIRQILLWKAD